MTVDNDDNYLLLSDEPVLEVEREDLLEFEHSAGVLARAALHARGPITIGVFGNWGSGKTSLMRIMWQIVGSEGRGDRAAVPVWFNAWQYEREEHLIIPLIATIARDIKKKEAEWERISRDDTGDETARELAHKALSIMKDGGKKVHDALRSVLYGVSMQGKLGVPLLGEIEISASMKDMIERYEAVTQDTLMARSLYFDAFDNLRALARDDKIEKPQIVVFIDDLDRCFPEQAVRLIESAKLVLHQPGFAFVLGIYPQIVEEFIRNKYAAQYPMAAAAATAPNDDELRRRMNDYLDYFKDYLGKIVQVHHDVPQRRPGGMRSYIRRLLTDASVLSEFVVEGVNENELFDLIAEVGKRNPREIVRKINGLVVKWRIANKEKREGEEYDLLAGLINEAYADRLSRDKYEYEPFLHRLDWLIDAESGQTYGQSLAQALEKTRDAINHGDRINCLLKEPIAEKSATMKSLIDTLRKDEHLCNVLKSAPGRRWISERKYREETRETYKEKEYSKDEMIARRVKMDTEINEMMAPSRESETKLSRDVEQIMSGLQLVSVPAGEFQMGSDDGSSDEKPVHRVKLDGFEIGATPVTQALYEAVMGTNPSYFHGSKYKNAGDRPVEGVSWDDAMVFCERLTQLGKESGWVFTLPSEAQWEYACRAGSTGKYCFGDEEEKLKDHAWYSENSGGETHPVRKKRANDFGLYDMHGNVWEWVQDDWHTNYERATEDGSAWVDSPRGTFRVFRGGYWGSYARSCRSAYRYFSSPDYRFHDVGFRVLAVRRVG